MVTKLYCTTITLRHYFFFQQPKIINDGILMISLFYVALWS